MNNSATYLPNFLRQYTVSAVYRNVQLSGFREAFCMTVGNGDAVSHSPEVNGCIINFNEYIGLFSQCNWC